MKKTVFFALAAPFVLAACGSTDEADAPAEPDNVEMPAEQVMMQPGMDEDPAVDPELADETGRRDVANPSPAPEPTPAAEEVADDAAAAADDLTAAINEEMAQ